MLNKGITRLALSRIEDQPDKAALIREEHLIKVGEYFLGQAQEAQQANRIEEAFKLAQITVRISPGNAKGKLFFANLLHSNFNRTDDAIQTLRHGLEFLNINDPLGRDYLDRYFQLLQLRERDAENEELRVRMRDRTVAVENMERQLFAETEQVRALTGENKSLRIEAQAADQAMTRAERELRSEEHTSELQSH